MREVKEILDQIDRHAQHLLFHIGKQASEIWKDYMMNNGPYVSPDKLRTFFDDYYHQYIKNNLEPKYRTLCDLGQPLVVINSEVILDNEYRLLMLKFGNNYSNEPPTFIKLTNIGVRNYRTDTVQKLPDVYAMHVYEDSVSDDDSGLNWIWFRNYLYEANIKYFEPRFTKNIIPTLVPDGMPEVDVQHSGQTIVWRPEYSFMSPVVQKLQDLQNHGGNA